MANFKMGFWNYVETGKLEPKEAVADWVKLGMNFAMSFEYNPEKHQKAELIKMLDECHGKNMQVVVCDKRTSWWQLTKNGLEAYEKGVKEAVEDFGSHPAVYGFHVGDEPGVKEMPDMILAYKTVKKCAPHLSPFVNLLPVCYAEQDGFEKNFGFKPEGYKDYLSKIVKEANLEMLAYDFYGQNAYFDLEHYQDEYFKNLVVFGEVARENGIPLYVSNLSVGHWGARCPNEDDFRWQISTSVAMGASGILWFFIYQRFLDSNFRLPPIDLYWEKTETFAWLSRENRIFMDFWAGKLDGYKWEGVKTLNMSVMNQPQFQLGDFDIEEVKFVINKDAPLLLAKFSSEADNLIVLVNVERDKPVRVHMKVKTAVKTKNLGGWLAPGQLTMVRQEK